MTVYQAASHGARRARYRVLPKTRLDHIYMACMVPSTPARRAYVADGAAGLSYRSPIFAGTLFTGSVRLRFGKGCDVRVITRFMSRIRSARPVGGLGCPSREAEALIRGCLGEPAMFAEVHPGEFSYPEIGIAVLARLFEEWRPGRAEVTSLFDRVGSVELAARRLPPDLARAEEDRFAAGMPESPFAAPTGFGED